MWAALEQRGIARHLAGSILPVEQGVKMPPRRVSEDCRNRNVAGKERGQIISMGADQSSISKNHADSIRDLLYRWMFDLIHELKSWQI